MKRYGYILTIVAAMGLLSVSAQATIVNLSASATGFGTTPAVTLNQGAASGIADGMMFNWNSGVTSPRLFSPSTNLQPYMTWTAAQTIRSVRIWADEPHSAYDRIVIDQLSGTNPTVEGDWTTVLDTGPGLNQIFADLDLGTTISTTGLRVRAFKTLGDISVGEVETFAPLNPAGSGAGTLSQSRIFPTSTAASSSYPGRGSGLTQDQGWYWTSSWLSETQAANPGTDFTYDLFFSNAAFDAVSLTWIPQGGFAAMPSSWELLVDTGSGLTSLGTFSISGSRAHYYHNLGVLRGVQQLQLRVAEANVAGGLGISLVEFEVFNTIPEPSTALLFVVGGGLLYRWQRRRQGCQTNR